jgi:hypothetical protein
MIVDILMVMNLIGNKKYHLKIEVTIEIVPNI